MNLLKKSIIFFISFLVFFNLSYPKKNSKSDLGNPVFNIPGSKKSVKIDGLFSEGEWDHALKIELNNEIMPGENIKPPVRTEAFIFHSATSVFVAFKAYDPDIKKIRAFYNDRDSIWEDDTVGVGFDTFNSGNRAYYFSANPLGIQGDEMFSLGGQYEDNAWDAIWESEARITDFGYVVEFKIPFNAIQFHPGSEELTWGLLLFRNYPRDKRYMISNSKMDRNQSCWICQLSKIVGFKGATPGRNLEFDPTLTGLRVDARDDLKTGKLENETSKLDPGISGKWGVTSNINLNFAINPDFSQIEADAAQLDINNQFALFFKEKRPFFLEGGDFFNSLFNVIHTRSIADPDFGLKVTGKQKGSAFGVFVTRDNTTNMLFPGAEGSDTESVEEKNWSSSVRYRLDLKNSSTIGFILTDREGDQYFNRLGGVDGLIKITKSDEFRFQILGSSTKYPDFITEEYDQKKESFFGSAFKIGYSKTNRNWFFGASHESLTPGFRADLGFIPQVDLKRTTAGVGALIWGKKNSFLSMLSVSVNGGTTYDHSGNLIERKAELSVGGEGVLQSKFFANIGSRRFVYDNVPFDQVYQHFFLSLNPTKRLKLELFARTGDSIDYDNTREGKVLVISPEFTYKIGRRISFSADLMINNLYIGRENLYKAFLSDIKFLYHFSKKMFFRAIIQFYDIKRNEKLYIDPVDTIEKNLFSQLLFSYKLNPRTVFYLGYSDIFEGYNGDLMVRSNRTLFLKIGYALVM